MNIDLTDREMQLLIDCIGTNIETVKRRHDEADPFIAELLTELADLDMDLREALHRKDDGWGDPDDPDLLMDPVDFAAKHDTDLVICDAGINAGINHDREGEVFVVAEDDFIQRGMNAREQAKANSRAAERRALKFSPPGPLGAKGDKPAPQPKDRTETQKVDLWDDSDPRNW